VIKKSVVGVVEVERLRCAHCKALFSVCTSCFRGQAYCSASCRATSARAIRRAANDRDQKSEEGRKDHRDRQRDYVARKKAELVESCEPPSPSATSEPAAARSGSVTDATSRKLDSSMKWPPRKTVIARRSLYVSQLMAFVVDKAVHLMCRVCGVLGTHIVSRRSRAPP
jgi:hypothetical protein